MSDQRIDTAKIRACSALLGEPSVTVVWQLANEVARLAAENAQKAARIAELERGCRCAECREPALHHVCEPCVLLVLERRQERIAELEAAARWRPMSAAPTGTVVLCANSRGTFFTARHDGEGWFDQNQLERDPVAWLPIPQFQQSKFAASVVADDPDELTSEDVDELSQSEWERDK